MFLEHTRAVKLQISHDDDDLVFLRPFQHYLSHIETSGNDRSDMIERKTLLYVYIDFTYRYQ